MDTKIKSTFWGDPEIERLSSDQILTTLWLMTNPRVNLLGFSEVSDNRFTFETKLNPDALQSTLKALPRAFVKVDGGVWVRNYIRHNIGDGETLVRNTLSRSICKTLEKSGNKAWAQAVLEEYPCLRSLLQNSSPCHPHPMPMASPCHGEREGEGKGVGDRDGKGGAIKHRSAEIAACILRVFRRTAPLNSEAQRALAALQATPEDIRLMEWFYGLHLIPEDKALVCRRTTADNLALNWASELDRARIYQKHHGPKKRDSGYPLGARAWLLSMRPPDERWYQPPELWSELPGDLRREWEGLPPEQQAGWSAKEAEGRGS